jgi:hypothetical protein
MNEKINLHKKKNENEVNHDYETPCTRNYSILVALLFVENITIYLK